MKSPHLGLAKNYWQKHLTKKDLAIDATCGNGYDTQFLATLCNVIGMDIQQSAVENTKKLLQAHGLNGSIFQLSHELIDTLPLFQKPKLIVYNLGYLPKGDKSLTTITQTTLISAKKSLKLLDAKGALSITCYPGHDEGEKEETTLKSWIQTLPPHLYTVTHHFWPRDKAPSLIWILKL